MILRAEGTILPIRSIRVKSPNAMKVLGGDGPITLATIEAEVTLPNGDIRPICDLFTSETIARGWSIETE